jgi:hypothetical protein
MEHVWQLLARIYVAVAAPHERDERGDVPGWVMITVMTAGLVAVITAVASTQLQGMLESAFAQVK